MVRARFRIPATRHRAMARRRMTPSLQRGARVGVRHAARVENALHKGICRLRHGAFMEASGRNRWQPTANGSAQKTAQIGRSATAATHGNAPGPDGKERVDGSSPSGGSAKAPQNGVFCIRADLHFRRSLGCGKRFGKTGPSAHTHPPPHGAFPDSSTSQPTSRAGHRRLRAEPRRDSARR